LLGIDGNETFVAARLPQFPQFEAGILANLALTGEFHE